MGCCMLGIGVINFVYYLVKNGVKYLDFSVNSLVYKIFEVMQYYLFKVLNNLVKEKGVCFKFNEIMYFQGVLLIDIYKKDLDLVCNELLYLDWEGLCKDIVEYGLCNFILLVLMLLEMLLQIFNVINGIELLCGYISVKFSKDGVFKQVVLEYECLKDQYELLWDILFNDGYLQLCGIMQKFVDQMILVNISYNLFKYENGKVFMCLLFKDLFIVYKLGVKILYYYNICDGVVDVLVEIISVVVVKFVVQEVVIEEDDDCVGGVCKI